MTEQSKPAGSISQAPLGGLRANILLVDDNPADLLSLRAILEDLGQNLVEARTGREAIAQLRQGEFAVVLLDVHMPGLDGFDTARIIRQENTPPIPIIFITAFESNQNTDIANNFREINSIRCIVFTENK